MGEINDQIKILEKAEELSEMILKSELVDYYYKFFKIVQSNKESMEKIRRFSQLKELYYEVKRVGAHHPDYKRVMKEIFEAKRDMDLDPRVAELKKAENEMQNLLDEISALLGHAVSEHIKVPAGNPFFASSKTCSCGSEGKCGCI